MMDRNFELIGRGLYITLMAVIVVLGSHYWLYLVGGTLGLLLGTFVLVGGAIWLTDMIEETLKD